MFARVALIVIASFALWALFARDSGADTPAAAYRVKQGDTLWSIALAHHGGDPREGVWELQRRNDLDGTTIHPGQLLVVP